MAELKAKLAREQSRTEAYQRQLKEQQAHEVKEMVLKQLAEENQKMRSQEQA